MSTIQLTSESSEPESQFNNGIKMIVSAYETQTTLLSNEISMLNSELEKRKDSRNGRTMCLFIKRKI